jgi:phosphoglycerate dehydrogenase-like enzyme
MRFSGDSIDVMVDEVSGRTITLAELNKLVIDYRMPPHLVERVRTTHPDIDVVVCTERAALIDALPGAEALVSGRFFDAELLANAPDLRWVHTAGTGVDAMLFPEFVESDIVLTNLSGVDVYNIPEHLIGMMLVFARDFLRLVRGQVGHRWMHGECRVFELAGQTLGIVGLGAIGQGLARKANALGMRVIGLRRQNDGDLPEGVEAIYPSDQLHQLLAESDHVAICLPLTPSTRHLFGAAEFAAMKPTAYLYNIGRGLIVDQDALIEALRVGQFAGAGLDVVTPEPLPDDSPLWDVPNVFITGHNAVYTPFYGERGIEVLLHNIECYLRDQPLSSVVDKRAGY